MSDDRREVLEAAFDEIEAGVAPEQAPAEPAIEVESPEAAAAPEADETAEQKAERIRDEAGRFAKAEKTAAKGRTVKPTPPAAAGTQAGAPIPPAAAPAAPVLPKFKPPQSWKPTVRELAAKLPPEFAPILEESVRRERETEIALQRAAEASKGVQPWQEAIRPYEAQIRAAGSEPVKYVGELLQTAHQLTYAPDHQKAPILASLIMQFGPSLLKPDQQDANGNPSCPLDRALVQMMQGRPMQAQTPQQQFRDPRLDQLLAQAQQRQAAQVAEMETEAVQTTQAFAQGHEFYGDVSDHMADILDVWAKQGKRTVEPADLERAYNLACSLNEDVSATLARRQKAEAVRTGASATARSRAAASSVRSQPTAAPAAQPADRRAALEAAADELGI